MHSDNEEDVCGEASGHSGLRSTPDSQRTPTASTCRDLQMHFDMKSKRKDFAGPYKDYHPPGSRTPAVGEKHWGDPPYFPSYLDPMYAQRQAAGYKDNLYCRGPFYRGVTETHTEFVNHGVVPRRQYNEFIRHYEEPGMKDERSVTQTDFQPPLPMLPRDKAPCLAEDREKPWYKPEAKEPKNPHAKEVVYRPAEPEVVYIDEGYKRDFTTEHNDNFVCYQKDKGGTKIQDPPPVVEEMYLKNIREAHQNCRHPPLPDNECDGSCQVRKRCPGPTPQKVSWLLQPKVYPFKNGVMLIPCKCRDERMQNC